jgi:alkylhydroperoxidase/carboxymuconolactone decarboxylase family protein YurZ
MNVKPGGAAAYPIEGFDWLAGFDPEFETARRKLAGIVWDPKRGALPLRYREIVASVALAFMGYPTCEAHIRRALAAGAKFREVVEAMQLVCVPGGHPCLHYAMPHLKVIEAELGDKANDGLSEGEAPPSKTVGPKLTVWPWMQKHYPEYEAARGALGALLWTPQKPTLAVKYREIMAMAILALRFYPTVPFHMRRAIEEGATVAELTEAIQVAALLGGMAVLHFCLPFLKELQEEMEAGKVS